MNRISKVTKGVSVAMACALLMAFSSPVLDPVKVNTDVDKDKTPPQVEDIYFSEDCSTCRYITIYDEYDRLVFDRLVVDTENINDVKLKNMLENSYFLMSNSIANYYILSK